MGISFDSARSLLTSLTFAPVCLLHIHLSLFFYFIFIFGSILQFFFTSSNRMMLCVREKEESLSSDRKSQRTTTICFSEAQPMKLELVLLRSPKTPWDKQYSMKKNCLPWNTIMHMHSKQQATQHRCMEVLVFLFQKCKFDTTRNVYLRIMQTLTLTSNDRFKSAEIIQKIQPMNRKKKKQLSLGLTAWLYLLHRSNSSLQVKHKWLLHRPPFFLKLYLIWKLF